MTGFMARLKKNSADADRATRNALDPNVVRRQLKQVVRCYENILKFEDGVLFSSVFSDHVNQLSLDIEAAAVQRQLEISPREHTTRPLLQSMVGAETDICFFVHHLDNNDFFFTSTHSTDFFLRVLKATESGAIHSVRRLFVSHHPAAEKADKRTPRLLEFHENVKAFDWRIIGAGQFAELARDANHYEDRLDFGIYGKRYVYVSTQRPARRDAAGVFFAAATEVERFTNFADTAWDNAHKDFTFGGHGPCRDATSLFGHGPETEALLDPTTHTD